MDRLSDDQLPLLDTASYGQPTTTRNYDSDWDRVSIELRGQQKPEPSETRTLNAEDRLRGQQEVETKQNRTLKLAEVIDAGAQLPAKDRRQLVKAIATLDDLIGSADSLDGDELRQLQAAIAALLQAKDLGDKEDEPPQNRTLTTGSKQRGSIELKKINGYGPYRYLRWWSGGKHRSTYLGKDERESE